MITQSNKASIWDSSVSPSVVLNCLFAMAELPPRSIHSFAGTEPGGTYSSPPLSNLHDPQSPLPPRYPPSWRPTNFGEFNTWNVSPQGMFPSTLVGPGQNPDPLPHPQPRHPPTTGTTPANNLLNSGSSTHLYGMRLTAALYDGAVRGQPVDSHVIICHTSVTCERHSHVCIYTTLGV